MSELAELLKEPILLFFQFSIFYYLAANTIYVVLFGLALGSVSRRMKSSPLLIETLKRRAPIHAPLISLIAPAFNEELSIVPSVKSFLTLNYPKYEVIVVNDGSRDATLEKLKEAFALEHERIPYDARLSETPIHGTYRSKLHPNLVVVDKANGGKADANNVGIGFAQHELFCAVDSDSILEEDALIRVVIPFLEDPARTIAAGGTIRVANGCRIRHSRVVEARLSWNPLVLMQVVEYIRAFLCGRAGWNSLNATLVISGAFGLFNRKAVMEVGGYLPGSLGEDMELVVRLHRLFRERKLPYRVVFIPDPVCWTEVPSSLAVLKRQRSRWQRGLAETLIKNRDMLLRPRFGPLGFVGLPYYWLFELLGPVVEVTSIFALTIAWTLGILDRELLVLFFLVGVVYGVLMTVSALLIESWYFPKYPRIRQFFVLLAMAVFESFGYRQLTSAWRLGALISYLRGNTAWGVMVRTGSLGESTRESKP